MKVAIYARVSTESQELEQQINTCKKYCDLKGWEYDVYTEKASSTRERPVFEEVLRLASVTRKYAVVVVFRLDRAWRSSRQFIMDIDRLNNVGANIVCVMEGLDPTTPMGKAMMTILVALAELERVNISQATKHRLDALRRMGKQLGRPSGSKDKHPRKTQGYHDRWSKKRGSLKPSSQNTQ